MRSCKEAKVYLSSQLVASTAAYLTKQQWWAVLDALLRGQALPSLTQCPGLVLAIVEGGHFSLLPGILPKVLGTVLYLSNCSYMPPILLEHWHIAADIVDSLVFDSQAVV